MLRPDGTKVTLSLQWFIVTNKFSESDCLWAISLVDEMALRNTSTTVTLGVPLKILYVPWRLPNRGRLDSLQVNQFEFVIEHVTSNARLRAATGTAKRKGIDRDFVG